MNVQYNVGRLQGLLAMELKNTEWNRWYTGVIRDKHNQERSILEKMAFLAGIEK